ncbi:hypothetical protein BDV28DRAFT_133534 [Aspergillus coremiiformis]|uniref:Uncharacterized protein n=1 Tax=Aspergillus coremiiformis TaxID=138285 RepID=A0A5N6Z7P2_9EURO|nr:hypothetical protein BDV28DRAFT_133534 [Aspergillus coremiiformis]
MDELNEYCALCLSTETLDVETTSDSLPPDDVETIVKRSPMLKRFVGYKEEISEPIFIGEGKQGAVFRFKFEGKDQCLKLFWKHEYPGQLGEKAKKLVSPFGCESRAFARLCERIIQNFQIAKRARIIPGDIEKRNYRGTYLVDLGSTVTFPFYRTFARERSFTDFYEDLKNYPLYDWD